MTEPRRVLRTKIFLGSTTEEIDQELTDWLEEKQLCPGNYVDLKLLKLGNVYQIVLVYATML